MSHVEVEAMEERPVLEIDPPAPTRPASLTGALVQRGRDRAAYAPEIASPEPMEVAPAIEETPVPAPEPAPFEEEVPLVFAPRDAAAIERPPSRFSDALFVVACCAAFFATFLFALRF